MSDPIKRLHYYDQQFLRSTDFTADQNYHISMRRLHNQVLHTWGVAQGLTLTLGASSVIVAPGVAVDSQGREMVVGAAINLDLSMMAVNTSQYVTIAYGEQTSDHSTESGAAGDTRWTEQPNVSLTTTLPADPSLTLVLGQITKAQDGSFSLNTTVRVPAAAIIPPDIAANSLTLKNSSAPAQWPRLTSGAANQAALNGNLTAAGDLSCNNLIATGNLSGAAANLTGIVTCDHVVQTNPALNLQVANSVSVGSPKTSGSTGSISASGDISGNNVTAAGKIASPMFKVSQPISCQDGTSGSPITATFSTSGGTVLVLATGTGFVWTGAGKQIGMEIVIDNVSRGFAKCMTNENNSHKSFSANPIVITGLSASPSHTITLKSWNGTIFDYNDFFSVTILELPF